MFRLLLASFLAITSCIANDYQKRLPLANQEGGPNALVHGCVNVITGEYIDSNIHLIIPGPEPLVYQTFYSTSMRWRDNHSCSAHFKKDKQNNSYNNDCFYCDPGTTCSNLTSNYRKSNETFLVDILAKENRGLTNIGKKLVSGQTNHKNYKLTLPSHWADTIVFESGSGTVNKLKKIKDLGNNATYFIQSKKHPNLNGLSYFTKFFSETKGNRHTELKAINYKNKEVYSNLKFRYEDDSNNADIWHITASDGRQIILTNAQHIRRERISPNQYLDKLDWDLTEIKNPNSPDVRYKYWYNADPFPFLTHKFLPDDRTREIKYIGHDKKQNGLPEGQKLRRHDDRRNRVYLIKEPVGTTNQWLPTCRLVYDIRKSGEGFTHVYDALNHETRYQYDELKRLKGKLEYLEIPNQRVGYRLYSWVWSDDDRERGNLLKETLWDLQSYAHFSRTYEYDDRGNVTRETLDGDFMGTEVMIEISSGCPIPESQSFDRCYRYSDNGLNLLLTEIDPDKKTEYSYLPGTDLLASKLVGANGEKFLREFNIYDENSIVIKKIIDDGCGDSLEDDNGVTRRLITTTIPRYSRPCFGLAETIIDSYWDPQTSEEKQLRRTDYKYTREGWVAREDVYDADDIYCYSIIRRYNRFGQVIEEVNPLGHIVTRDYDANGNMICEKGPCPGYVKQINYDYSNRPIRITEADSTGFSTTTSYQYDLVGNVIKEIDEYGNEINYTYDSLNRLVAKILPAVITLTGSFERPIETKKYDIFDNPTQVVDAEGRHTSSRYTAYKKPCRVTYADGTVEKCEYNLNGTLKKQVARNFVETHFEYDPMERETLRRAISPSGDVLETHQRLYEGSSLKAEIDTAGHVTEYEYDGAGRKIAVKKEGRLTTFEYDTLGREAVVKQWLNDNDYTASIKVYDFLDQVIEEKTEDGLGTVQTLVQYDYDEMGNCIRVKTFRGNSLAVTETEYDCRKRPLRITNSEGNVTVFEYNTVIHQGQKVLQKVTTDPLGIQKIETHDSLQRIVLLEKKDPFGELLFKQEVGYDKIGNRVKTVTTVITPDQDNREITTLWEYNSENQVICLMEAVGTKEQRITRIEYTSFGEKQCVAKPDGVQIKYAYNDYGLVEAIDSTGNHNSVSYRYIYDDQKNLIEVIDRRNHLVTKRRYNEHQELTCEILGNELIMAYEKDHLGRNKSIKFHNQSPVAYKYSGIFLKEVSWKGYNHTYDRFDLSGKVVHATLVGRAGTLDLGYDLLGREIKRVTSHWEQQAEFDALGKLISRKVRDRWGKEECDYHYDKLNQLSEETGFARHSYIHDSLSNRVESDGEPIVLNDLHQIISHRGTTYTYDPCGNLISDGTSTYQYDDLDRLVCINQAGTQYRYIYDAFNRRIMKEQYVNGERVDQICYLYQGDCEVGAISNGHEEYRVLGLGLGAELGAAVMVNLDGWMYAPIHDQVGGLVSLVSAFTGWESASYRYSAFGRIEEHKGIDSPWLYSSKRLDTETGWLYFGRRYYSPDLGRWTTCDPKGYSEGPNLYAYVYNNPLMLFDLYGLSTRTWDDRLGVYRHDSSAVISTKGRRVHQRSPCHLTHTVRDKKPTSQCSWDRWEHTTKRENFTFVYDIGAEDDDDNIHITYTNGMMNRWAEDSISTSRWLSDQFGGRNVMGFYNACHGFITDLFECMLGLIFKTATTPALLMAEDWTETLRNNPNAMIIHIGHSQGCIHTARALELMDEDLRKRIHIIAVGPGEYINPENCGSVNHLVCNTDGVAMIDQIGRFRYRDTIRFLERDASDSLLVHGIDTVTYRKALQNEINNLKRNLKM